MKSEEIIVCLKRWTGNWSILLTLIEFQITDWVINFFYYGPLISRSGHQILTIPASNSENNWGRLWAKQKRTFCSSRFWDSLTDVLVPQSSLLRNTSKSIPDLPEVARGRWKVLPIANDINKEDQGANVWLPPHLWLPFSTNVALKPAHFPPKSRWVIVTICIP